MKVMLTLNHGLHCLWWLNPPFNLVWDRPGIPSSTWLASRPTKRAALDLAAAEGWEVVG